MSKSYKPIYHIHYEIKSPLSSLIDLLLSIDETFSDGHIENDVIANNLTTLRTDIENEICKIFENIPADKDGVKKYTDPQSKVNTYNSVRRPYEYHCNGILYIGDNKHIILKPFDFEPESENIVCDYKNMFRSTCNLLQDNYYHEQSDLKMTYMLPDNMSVMTSDYIRSLVIDQKIPKALSIIKLKKEIAKTLKTLTKNNNDIKNIIIPRYFKIKTKYDKLYKKVSAIVKKYEYAAKIDTVASELINTVTELKDILNILTANLEKCYDLEKTAAIILNYIMDSHEAHTGFVYKNSRDPYFTCDRMLNLKRIVGQHTNNDSFKTMLSAEGGEFEQAYRMNYAYSKFITGCTNLSDFQKTKMFKLCRLPELTIPYILKDDAICLINAYEKEYEQIFDRYEKNNTSGTYYKYRHMNNENLHQLEIAHITSQNIIDAHITDNDDIIKHLDLSLTDKLFKDINSPAPDNPEPINLTVNTLMQETYVKLIPIKHVNNDIKNLHYSSESLYYNIMNNIDKYVEHYNETQQYIESKLNFMLELFTKIQKQMSEIPDPSFHEFLIKSGMIEN